MAGWIQQLWGAILDARELIQLGGTLAVCTIVFIETGLLAGFFLPGDSLLVTSGIFAAAGHLPLGWLLVLVPLCAFGGDQLGYWIGRRAGQALYRRPDSRLIKRRYIEQAHQFYEAHGAAAIVLARFVPIARTFCPAVAGAAQMSYRKFVLFDAAGALFWGVSLQLTGYFLGTAVPQVERRIHWVIAVVVLLSILPGLTQVLRSWRRRRAATSRELSGS